MQATPTVTIAIPTYNRASMLRKLLTCMMEQETGDAFSYEILVIDDSSTDDTPAVVEELSNSSPVPIRYILEQGIGATGVLNRAVKEFRGEWLAICDDDQLVNSDWLRLLLSAAIEQNADYTGGPLLLDLPESVLAGIGPVCRDLHGESPDAREPEKYAKTPPRPSGGNRLVRRSVFEQIGNHDMTILTGGGDRDFMLRAVDGGIAMGWHPDAAARHLIQPERFTYNHIKWYSMQFGCSFAQIDCKRKGKVKTTLFCTARIGQTLLVNLPLLLMAHARKNPADIMDRYALLWRAVGYTRRTLQLIAPSLFPQENFFSRVEFRRIRENS